MTTSREAYDAWDRKDQEIRKVRSEYIVIDDLVEGQPMRMPTKSLIPDGVEHLKRLQAELEELWDKYLQAVQAQR